MTTNARWTRQQLLVAFSLYCRLPFGRLHQHNPEIINTAKAVGRSPSALAMKLNNIASLDPEITSTGRTGLRGSSATDRAMWDEMQSDWEAFALETQRATDALEIANSPHDDMQIAENPEVVGEDRAIETTTRVGQAFFRRAVLSAYNGRCCVTGLSLPVLLRAAHIIPWRIDESNRVNPRNGLLLSVLHERAFDAGLFTIESDLKVRVSGKSTSESENDDFYAMAIGRYDGKPIMQPEKFSPDQEFLAYHRDNIFAQ